MRLLPSQRNTPAIERLILRAARDAGLGTRTELQADFEHGHWWITNRATGAQWDAVDAEPSDYGFDFEQVTEADE